MARKRKKQADMKANADPHVEVPPAACGAAPSETAMVADQSQTAAVSPGLDVQSDAATTPDIPESPLRVVPAKPDMDGEAAVEASKLSELVHEKMVLASNQAKLAAQWDACAKVSAATAQAAAKDALSSVTGSARVVAVRRAEDEAAAAKRAAAAAKEAAAKAQSEAQAAEAVACVCDVPTEMLFLEGGSPIQQTKAIQDAQLALHWAKAANASAHAASTSEKVATVASQQALLSQEQAGQVEDEIVPDGEGKTNVQDTQASREPAANGSDKSSGCEAAAALAAAHECTAAAAATTTALEAVKRARHAVREARQQAGEARRTAHAAEAAADTAAAAFAAASAPPPPPRPEPPGTVVLHVGEAETPGEEEEEEEEEDANSVSSSLLASSQDGDNGARDTVHSSLSSLDVKNMSAKARASLLADATANSALAAIEAALAAASSLDKRIQSEEAAWAQARDSLHVCATSLAAAVASASSVLGSTSDEVSTQVKEEVKSAVEEARAVTKNTVAALTEAEVEAEEEAAEQARNACHAAALAKARALDAAALDAQCKAHALAARDACTSGPSLNSAAAAQYAAQATAAAATAREAALAARGNLRQAEVWATACGRYVAGKDGGAAARDATVFCARADASAAAAAQAAVAAREAAETAAVEDEVAANILYENQQREEAARERRVSIAAARAEEDACARALTIARAASSQCGVVSLDLSVVATEALVDYDVFVVSVTVNECQCLVRQRYTDLRQLDAKMRDLGTLSTPFPPKKFFGARDPAFLNTRMADLDNYMKELSAQASPEQLCAAALYLLEPTVQAKPSPTPAESKAPNGSGNSNGSSNAEETPADAVKSSPPLGERSQSRRGSVAEYQKRPLKWVESEKELAKTTDLPPSDATWENTARAVQKLLAATQCADSPQGDGSLLSRLFALNYLQGKCMHALDFLDAVTHSLSPPTAPGGRRDSSARDSVVSVEVLAVRGWLLRRCGRHEEAKVCLTDALDLWGEGGPTVCSLPQHQLYFERGLCGLGLGLMFESPKMRVSSEQDAATLEQHRARLRQLRECERDFTAAKNDMCDARLPVPPGVLLCRGVARFYISVVTVFLATFSNPADMSEVERDIAKDASESLSVGGDIESVGDSERAQALGRAGGVKALCDLSAAMTSGGLHSESPLTTMESFNLCGEIPEILAFRAQVYGAMGYKDDALQDIETALSLNPSIPHAFGAGGAWPEDQGQLLEPRAPQAIVTQRMEMRPKHDWDRSTFFIPRACGNCAVLFNGFGSECVRCGLCLHRDCTWRVTYRCWAKE